MKFKLDEYVRCNNENAIILGIDYESDRFQYFIKYIDSKATKKYATYVLNKSDWTRVDPMEFSNLLNTDDHGEWVDESDLTVSRKAKLEII